MPTRKLYQCKYDATAICDIEMSCDDCDVWLTSGNLDIKHRRYNNHHGWRKEKDVDKK